MVETILKVVPDNPEPSAHYLFYLHGLIVELGGIRPFSEEHGFYEYEQILAALAGDEFVVISEARVKGTKVVPYAEKIAEQVRTLLIKQVPPENIVIMGASKGGVIGAHVSNILKTSGLNYVFLAGLFEKYLDQGVILYGNVLSIHDLSDTLAMAPDLYFERSEGNGTFQKVVLDVDLGHGIIYQPYPHWLVPFREWFKKR